MDERGLAGDRIYAVEDTNGKFGSGKTTRRFRLLKGLFDLSARTGGSDVFVSIPDEPELPVGSHALDAALSERYGEELRVTREQTISHFDVAAVHVVTTASLRWLSERLGKDVSARRFRPNLVLAAPGAALSEHEWLGAKLELGSCVLQITATAERCVMATNAQSELPHDPGILRGLVQLSDMQFGVYATVVVPGTISEGDPVAIRRDTTPGSVADRTDT